MGLEPGVEDDYGGYLVDKVLAVAEIVAGFVEDLVGGAGGEALVNQDDRDFGAGLECFGKLVNLEGPGAGVAGKVEGVADEDFSNLMLAEKAEDGAQVFVAVLAVESKQGLGGVAEGVGECYADANFAYVQGHDAGGKHTVV